MAISVFPSALPFSPDGQQVCWALDFLTGRRPLGFVPRGRLRGIELHSTDMARSWGHGDEIRGPAPLLMMAVAGRIDVLAMLEGPGVDVLRERLSI